MLQSTSPTTRSTMAAHSRQLCRGTAAPSFTPKNTHHKRHHRLKYIPSGCSRTAGLRVRAASRLLAMLALACFAPPFPLLMTKAFVLFPSPALISSTTTTITDTGSSVVRIPRGAARRSRRKALIVSMSGQGFGKSVDPPAASQTTTPGTVGEKEASEGRGSGDGGEGGGDAQKGVVSWEKEYKAYIKRTGQYLCSMSWEGHEEMGRGAIFANYDDAQAGGKLNEADKFGGIPSMYVPLTQFESMKASGKSAELDDLGQIVRRVNSYRPEKEFVVVFQAAGVMGADIVRPNISPPEMARHVVKSDGVSTIPSASGLDGVIDIN